MAFLIGSSFHSWWFDKSELPSSSSCALSNSAFFRAFTSMRCSAICLRASFGLVMSCPSGVMISAMSGVMTMAFDTSMSSICSLSNSNVEICARWL